MSRPRRLALCALAFGAVVCAAVLLARVLARREAIAAPAVARSAAQASPGDGARDVVSEGGAPRALASAQDCRSRPERCDEAQLMALASELVEREPEQARTLLQQADGRFGARHELRRVLEIEVLVRTGQVGLAHARASHFYRSFPGSRYGADVERLTGYHPRPAGHE